MKLIFCHKSVSGHVETVEVKGYPGVFAQITKNGVANLLFDDDWSELAAKNVTKALLNVEDPELQLQQASPSEVVKSQEFEVETIAKNEDLMIQTAWGYVSREKGSDEPVVDVSGDILTIDELRKGVHHFVSKSGQIKDNHSNKYVGHIVEAMVFDEETRKHALSLKEDEQIPDGHDGVLLKIQYTDRKHWNEEVKTGKKAALSLGGRARRTKLR